MALSKQEKESLHEHFLNRDLYDPSKEQDQQVASFVPKGMNMGGECGYADGGDVQLGSDVTGIDETGKNIGGMPDPMAMEPSSDQFDADQATAENKNPLSQNAFDRELNQGNQLPQKSAISSPAAAPITATAPAPGKMAPNEYDQLIQYLSQKPSFGQSAMSGLAGLADAISTGVARAPSPGFQKNMAESQQVRKQDLINALRGKYEAGFKGTELEQAQQRIAQEAARNAQTAKHETATEELGKAGQALSEKEAAERIRAGQEANLGANIKPTGMFNRWMGPTAEQKKLIDLQEKQIGINNAPKLTPLTATNNMGHKIVSVDGGKTWQPMK